MRSPSFSRSCESRTIMKLPLSIARIGCQQTMLHRPGDIIIATVINSIELLAHRESIDAGSQKWEIVVDILKDWRVSSIESNFNAGLSLTGICACLSFYSHQRVSRRSYDLNGRDPGILICAIRCVLSRRFRDKICRKQWHVRRRPLVKKIKGQRDMVVYL